MAQPANANQTVEENFLQDYSDLEEELKVYKSDMSSLKEFTGLTERNLVALKKGFGDKGSIGLFFDRRVSEQHRWLFWFFTFKSSNKEDVIKNIKEFESFFQDLHLRVQDIEKLEGVNQIRELRKTFNDVVDKARSKKECTTSRTVNRMCRDIISEEREILRRLDRVEIFLQRKFSYKNEKNLKEAKEIAAKNQEAVDNLKVINESLVNVFNNLQETFAAEKADHDKRSKNLESSLKSSLEDNAKLRDVVQELMDRLNAGLQ